MFHPLTGVYLTECYQFRNFLVNGQTGWLKSNTTVLTTIHQGMAIQKGNVISILTNIGSPVRCCDWNHGVCALITE